MVTQTTASDRRNRQSIRFNIWAGSTLCELAQSENWIRSWPDIEQDRLDFIAESLSSAYHLCLLLRRPRYRHGKVNFLGSVPVLSSNNRLGCRGV
jgi:hypothetical protein